ncbi:GPI transamidase component PIG-T [Zancudomyces culisetae]|uniref:GPI transamidase component PIG-T n=1 Tax=Zancudomyces culisetae TaxID=1213189 RepID=A0A1R1PZ56_ZANCU|nr:GPI transamidase component PIG-T [Zancudomyces culisetae]|eukprot:OMH86233.1 GPI transamidase component PIG-T [Zancudomyces culisetae]
MQDIIPNHDFEEHYEKRQADWKELINSLSGVFCASLNQADMKNVVLPQFAYIDNTSIGGGNNDQKVSSTDFFHVFLAQENLCTENLTPFLKQLPCQAKGGIASLLNAHKLLNSEYYSMAISHTEECVDEQCKKKQWKFKQSITVVFKNDGDTIDTEKLFKAKLTKICPVSESSKIYFIKEKSDPSISLSSLVQSSSAKEIEIDDSTRALEFDLLATELEPKIEINVAEFKKEKRIDYIVGVHKHITGPPGVKGGIQIVYVFVSNVFVPLCIRSEEPILSTSHIQRTASFTGVENETKPEIYHDNII